MGAPGASRGGQPSAGEAYLFNASTGTLLQTLVHPEPSFYSQFGASVALVGNYAVIAAPGHSPAPFPAPRSSGALFVFDVNTGGYVGTFLNPVPRQNANFPTGDGAMMTAIGTRLAAGHAFGPGGGQVYLVAVPEPTAITLASMATVLLSRARRGCRDFVLQGGRKPSFRS